MLGHLFDGEFDFVEAEREVHRTPTGAEQRFVWSVFRRRSSEPRRLPHPKPGGRRETRAVGWDRCTNRDRL